MIKIAHRGNRNGRDPSRENTIPYIEDAIAAGFSVMVDVWLLEDKWFLGYDLPKEVIDLSFMERPEIWVRARDLPGYVSLHSQKKVHVFWHTDDDFTFTSKGIKWAKTDVLTRDGVMFMPKSYIPKIRLGRVKPLGVCLDNFDLIDRNINPV
jgi:hypothetical protein